MTPKESLSEQSATTEHVHKWQPNGLVRTQGVSRSPCSRWDDTLYTKVSSVLVCECGATKSRHVANEDVRRRGDDLRAGKENTRI